MVAARKPERTQRERREETTRALIEAARRLFARDGFSVTSLNDIAGEAGVTKGALYHHFPGGKTEVFRAVYEDEQRRLARITSAAYLREKEPWKGLYAGCRAFFEEIQDPQTQRITLIDGPAVLGHAEVRSIEEDHAIAQMKHALRRAMEAGIIAKRQVEPLASMLFAAICEGASMSVRSKDPRRTARQALGELRTLLDSMRIDR